MSEALADLDRRRILARLGHAPVTVAALAADLPLDPAVVTAHLEVLRRAGLVQDDPQVPGVHALRAEGLVGIDRLLSSYEELWRSRVDALHVEVARDVPETEGKQTP